MGCNAFSNPITAVKPSVSGRCPDDELMHNIEMSD